MRQIKSISIYVTKRHHYNYTRTTEIMMASIISTNSKIIARPIMSCWVLDSSYRLRIGPQKPQYPTLLHATLPAVSSSSSGTQHLLHKGSSHKMQRYFVASWHMRQESAILTITLVLTASLMEMRKLSMLK